MAENKSEIFHIKKQKLLPYYSYFLKELLSLLDSTKKLVIRILTSSIEKETGKKS